ncbi:MAG: archaeal proteasome endopeptidase complex subunit beta [Desulfurococcales archaeon]|nr:archaeal proteasome endopeptidase complex subunit beta [Desulfurococcales archaeon]
MSFPFGATAVGVRAKDGVVLVTDRRMSYGSFVMSRNAKKVYKVNDKVAAAFAGLYGDIGGLFRMLQAEIKYHELTTKTPLTLMGMAKRLSTILYSYRYYPFYVEILLGGIEKDGSPGLYVLDSLGSITEEPYAAIGSGATIALGTLENEYRDNMSVEDAEKLAVKSARSAIGRDAMSGDGMDVVVISRAGSNEKTIWLKLVETG